MSTTSRTAVASALLYMHEHGADVLLAALRGDRRVPPLALGIAAEDAPAFVRALVHGVTVADAGLRAVLDAEDALFAEMMMVIQDEDLATMGSVKKRAGSVSRRSAPTDRAGAGAGLGAPCAPLPGDEAPAGAPAPGDAPKARTTRPRGTTNDRAKDDDGGRHE